MYKSIKIYQDQVSGEHLQDHWFSGSLYLLFRYTKPKGQLPDYTAPIVLKGDKTSVEDFCNKVHRTIIKEFK